MKFRLYLRGALDVEVEPEELRELGVIPTVDRGEVLIVSPSATEGEALSANAVLVNRLLGDQALEELRDKYGIEMLDWSTVCRVCDCTEEEACMPEGCEWVEPDLCSSCVNPPA